MTSSRQPARPLVTSGTRSWDRDGAEAEQEMLAEFLEDVAASDTIQTAMSLAVERMQLAPGDAVLDLGCGTGVFFAALATAVGPSGRIVGLDHAAGFLTDARARADAAGFGATVTLTRGDAHALPFPDHHFDAAHTERVLMHLTDPDAALRELRRVVRPGGWIVCVEPDLNGMRLDLADAEKAAKLLAGFCASIRNPAMGLELNRRMASAGLVDRRIDVLTEVERDYDDADFGFFERAADTAVERGWLTRDDAAATLDAIRSAKADGVFTSYSSMFIVAGRVPGGR